MQDKELKKLEICKRCGAKCCKTFDYVNWYVVVTLRDIKRICTWLKMPVDKFVREYIYMKPCGTYSIPVLKVVNGVCKFLKDDVCTIHEVKPIACRTYPVYVPGMFYDPRCPLSKHPELLDKEHAHVSLYVQESLETEQLLQEYDVRTEQDLINLLLKVWDKI